MAWITPKTNWVAGDVPNKDDFNRIEGNIADIKPAYLSGDAWYKDAIAGSTEIIKTIPIGANKRQGRLFVRNASMAGTMGISVFFTTNQDRTVGIGYESTAGFIYATAWNGSVASGNSILGADTENLHMKNAFISGTNLVIIFKNDNSTAKTLNASVDWEVW